MKKNLKKTLMIFILFFISLTSFKTYSAQKNYLMVFAPASLKDSLNEVLLLYKKEKSIEIKEVYLGTAQLAQQIKNGASPDFFISANIEWMEHLEQRELILKDYTFILTDNAAYVMQFVGPPFTFSIRQVGSNCGCIGQHAMKYVNGAVYWMGESGGFFVFDGTVKSLPCAVEDFVFTTKNGNNLGNFYYGK